MSRIAAPLLASILATSSLAHAGTFYEPANYSFYGGIGQGISETDISNRNHDNTSMYLKGYSGIKLSKNWGMELGGMWFDDIDMSGKDSVGEYEIKFRRYDLYAGPTLQFKPRWFIPVRLMAGLSYSKLDMEVHESFYGLAKGDTTSIGDHVTGTYLSAGIVPFQSRNISGLISIDYLKRADFFSGSNRPLDFRDMAISFRLGFH